MKITKVNKFTRFRQMKS